MPTSDRPRYLAGPRPGITWVHARDATSLPSILRGCSKPPGRMCNLLRCNSDTPLLGDVCTTSLPCHYLLQMSPEFHLISYDSRMSADTGNSRQFWRRRTNMLDIRKCGGKKMVLLIRETTWRVRRQCFVYYQGHTLLQALLVRQNRRWRPSVFCGIKTLALLRTVLRCSLFCRSFHLGLPGSCLASTT